MLLVFCGVSGNKKISPPILFLTEHVRCFSLARLFFLRFWPSQVHSLEPHQAWLPDCVWQEHKQHWQHFLSPSCLPSKFKSSKTTTTNPKTMRGWHGFRSKSASPCFWFQSNETCHQFVPPWSSSSCDWLDWTQEQIKDGSPSNENIWTLKMSPMLSYTLYKY